MKFGMMAVKTLAATVIRKYRFFTDYERVEDVEVDVHIVLKAMGGVRVSVELRD